MRLAVLIAVLTCATTAQAENARENRYGPAPARAPTALNGQAPAFTGATYGARTLGWTGKKEAPAPETVQAAPAPWWTRASALAPAAPVPSATPTSFPSQAPLPVTAPGRALPQSIYDAPPMSATNLIPPQPVQPAPQFQPGQVGARTYSVGRQFGMTPDPIPAAGPSRMVLIAAPPAATEDEAKPNVEGGGEWSGRSLNNGDQ